MIQAQKHTTARIRNLLQRLSTIDPQGLTEAEQEALAEVTASAQARAAAVVQRGGINPRCRYMTPCALDVFER